MPIVITDKATHRETQQPFKAAAELVDIRANVICVEGLQKYMLPGSQVQ
jgi:hypothetical protein